MDNILGYPMFKPEYGKMLHKVLELMQKNTEISIEKKIEIIISLNK